MSSVAAMYGARIGQGFTLEIEVRDVDLSTVTARAAMLARGRPPGGQTWVEVSGDRIRASFDGPRSFVRAAPMLRGRLTQGLQGVSVRGMVQWRRQVLTVWVPLLFFGVLCTAAAGIVAVLLNQAQLPAAVVIASFFLLSAIGYLPAIAWARVVPKQWWPQDFARLERDLRAGLEARSTYGA